jgi:LuxR family maltose regulon positive regulatory protein
LLADRLDLFDPGLLPDALALGLSTAAALAHHDGQSERAVELLALLDQRAATRSLPRLRAIAASELVRLHTDLGDLAACRPQLVKLRELAAVAEAAGSLNATPIRLMLAFSEARHLLAAGDPGAAAAASASISQARKSANRLLELEGRLIHAAALIAAGQPPPADLEAVIAEAETRRLRRMLRALGPRLRPWIPFTRGVEAPGVRGREAADTAVISTMLTPREAEVLRLLARGLSNKEIARALEIGEGTIKWHLKNLFAKFDAAERKELVSRAALLGLVSPWRGRT